MTSHYISQGSTSGSIPLTSNKYRVLKSQNSLYELIINNTDKKLQVRSIATEVVTREIANWTETTTYTAIILTSSNVKLKASTGTDKDISNLLLGLTPNTNPLFLLNNGTLTFTNNPNAPQSSSSTTPSPSPSSMSSSVAQFMNTMPAKVESDLQVIEDMFLNRDILAYSILIIVFSISLIVIIAGIFTFFKSDKAGAIALLMLNVLVLFLCIIMLISRNLKKKKNKTLFMQFNNQGMKCQPYQYYASNSMCADISGYKFNNL